MKDKKYKLVGIENEFNITPDTVYPIYADDENNLYRGYSSGDKDEKCFTFTHFVKVNNNSNIKLLENCMTRNDLETEYFGIGDVFVIAMELSKDVVYVGRMDQYLQFIKDNYEAIKNTNGNNDFIERELNDQIDYLSTLVEEAKSQGAIPQGRK